MSATNQVNPMHSATTDQVESEQGSTRENTKNVRVMSEPSTGKKAIGKADARYWQQKGKLILDARSRFYCCKIQIRGRRESFPLRTATKATAAAKAAHIYGDVVSLGWDKAIALHKPDEKPAKGSTVGDLIAAVTKLSDVRPATLAYNVASFRRIVANIAGITSTAGRYAKCGEDRSAWLAAIDAVPLSRITPASVEAWKLSYVAERGKDDHDKQRSARNSANTFLRCARSLFSKRLLQFITPLLELPAKLPFEGVEQFPRQSMRYKGGVNAMDLISQASLELGSDSAKQEEWKAFILALFAGLRRNEVDKLRWQSIDLEAGVVRIVSQRDFSPKAETSLGEVPLEPQVIAILRGIRAKEPKADYVLAGTESKPGAKYRHYRADKTFSALTAWLNGKGITARTPMHTLRKEAGSLVCESSGLLAASRFLRHADVAITAQHYASQKQRVTIGLGNLLSDEDSTKIVNFSTPTKSHANKLPRRSSAV